jgi:ADP-ribose pyrophosphatase YjhB (NUDIX family)
MSGNETHRYPEPAVGALIMNSKGQVLLAKSDKWQNRFTLPGGHIELGETAEQALKREIKEEVGLEIEPIKFLQFQEAIYSPNSSIANTSSSWIFSAKPSQTVFKSTTRKSKVSSGWILKKL